MTQDTKIEEVGHTAPNRIRVAQDADGFWTCREAVSGSQEYVRADIVDDAMKALIAAKREMWLAARATWTLADFSSWAVTQQINAALEQLDGKPRISAMEIAKAEGRAS